MIYSEKVRAMDDKQKLRYFIEQLVGEDTTDNSRADALAQIQNILKGCPLESITERFGIETEFDFKKSPATMTLRIPGTDKEITCDLAVPDRDQFFDAHPEANARPIKSFLDDDEKKDVQEMVDSK